ncbi:hypothetical protein SJS40_21715 [Aeromonas caviae]|uniref:hypothetical protein n=1 Tax=Aeromonas caviae TaxID=648 RepID=UPI0029D980CC|nr:hypothetical protein [Aeromonas caviae]MDX7756108.1 hypothetical protein [Aeromonas caviae]
MTESAEKNFPLIRTFLSGKVIGIAEQRKIASAAAISPEPFTTIHDEEQALAPDGKARQVTLI